MSDMQVTCPNCGSVINLSNMQYANIVTQVRDKEFQKMVDSQVETRLAAEIAKITAVSSRDEISKR